MLQVFPENAATRLGFDTIRDLLLKKCETATAAERVRSLKFSSRIDTVLKLLQQTAEYAMTLTSGSPIPNSFSDHLDRELKLLSISGSVLQARDLGRIRALAGNMKDILQWFKGKEGLFPELFVLVADVRYEPHIASIVNGVLDMDDQIKDNASADLMQIRTDLQTQRNRLRKTFEGIIRKLAKQGYLADISESFLNGRRTVAVAAEYKRVVKGILHGSSDTQKTVYIEPEETVALNNDVAALEREEDKEVRRILAAATAALLPYHSDLQQYYRLAGLFDFVRAKALLAKEMDAVLPQLSVHPGVRLTDAVHPLLFLQNKRLNKPTIPLNLTLNRDQRILMISGPNAGGKTVAMKTVGLLQLMLQAGLLVPVDPRSEMGIFGQLMVHIGDTQSIENELSTYSAHLKEMKYFLDFANGRTLFLIDELGSGSDPNLGGAFAEAIVEQLAEKRSFGLITTHYLNLKLMAGRVKGIINGAMAFDEQQLLPLYRLQIGKPGSSYTFAIAQRSGLSEKLIARARKLTEQGHFKLDKMLLHTEQQSVRLQEEEKKLAQLILKHEQAVKKYENLADKERRKQQVETLKLQNKIKQQELTYLKDMERKFKQIIQDWKKSENKQEVITAAEKILFKRKQVQQNAAAARKADKRFRVTGAPPQVGDMVRHTVNHQVGRVLSVNDKKAVVKMGNLPFTVSLDDWVVVVPKNSDAKEKGK